MYYCMEDYCTMYVCPHGFFKPFGLDLFCDALHAPLRKRIRVCG